VNTHKLNSTANENRRRTDNVLYWADFSAQSIRDTFASAADDAIEGLAGEVADQVDSIETAINTLIERKSALYTRAAMLRGKSVSTAAAAEMNIAALDSPVHIIID
jgi:hypothetical protein